MADSRETNSLSKLSHPRHNNILQDINVFTNTTRHEQKQEKNYLNKQKQEKQLNTYWSNTACKGF